MKPALDTATVLSRSVGLLLEAPRPLLAIALILQAPHLVLALARDTGGLVVREDAFSPLAVVAILLPALVLTQLQAGIVAPGVAAHLTGQPLTIGACLAQDPATLLRILITAIAIGSLATAGFMFFVIPGWVVLSAFFVALPLVSLGRRDPKAAIETSWRLVMPQLLSILPLVFVFTVAGHVLTFGASLLDAPVLVSELLGVPISSLQAVAATIAYRDLTGEETPT